MIDKTELIDYVNRALSHDERAIETLYQYTYPNACALAKHLCSNPDDVDDILQESYITAFTQLDTLREKAAFPFWLRKIVVNTWRAFAKDKSNYYETLVQDIPEEGIDTEQMKLSVQDEVELLETRREISELVDALPESHRLCVKLYYYEEMSVDEIAAILDIPSGTVMSRLYYGRKRLKEEIEQRGIHSFSVSPQAANAADPLLLSKILTVLQAASNGGTAASAGGIALKLCAGLASLLALGGLISIPALINDHPQPTPSAATAQSVTTTETTTASSSTIATTAATTVTTASQTTAATVPKPYVSFEYEDCDGGIIITSYSGTEPDVKIPDVIDGKTVTAIGSGAFKNSRVLRSAVIPSSVTSIGSNAFRECRALQSVTFGGGVSYIGDMAFLGCSSLRSVHIPSNVREISIYAFAYCTRLQQVTINEGVEIIGYSAFRQCPSLQNVNLPASLTDIGGDAFDGTPPELVLSVPDHSCSLDYAVENGLPYILS